MKIAQVTPYDFSHPGGVSEHIGHLRDEFTKLGHEVVVLAPKAHKGGLEIGDGFYGIGRTVGIPGNGSKVRLTFDVTLYAAVKELIQRERFDIVHLHEPLTPVLPYMVLLNSRAVNIATFHAFRTSNPWYTAFKPYMSFVLSRLDARIAVSEPAREMVEQYFEGPYEVIPNGIDTSQFGEHIEPFPWAFDGTPRILFVGRYNEPRKGFKYLLRALPLIQQQFPKARLMVGGTGDQEKFDSLMERERIHGVDYIGFISREELPRYYASCDVFCAPSIYRESFGIVLLEAAASCRPVVATNIPGYASVLTNEQEALLVEPRDPQALALAIVRVLADRSLQTRLAARGKETAAQYAWPKVAARVLECYERARAGAALADWRRA
ncbi:MAG: glycosyltransferase family 4 protein [Thermomicrobiales bacterium]|nr:glycosyltransferase family 4 protein [Thermomicrobiales bacterium]